MKRKIAAALAMMMVMTTPAQSLQVFAMDSGIEMSSETGTESETEMTLVSEQEETSASGQTDDAQETENKSDSTGEKQTDTASGTNTDTDAETGSVTETESSQRADSQQETAAETELSTELSSETEIEVPAETETIETETDTADGGETSSQGMSEDSETVSQDLAEVTETSSQDTAEGTETVSQDAADTVSQTNQTAAEDLLDAEMDAVADGFELPEDSEDESEDLDEDGIALASDSASGTCGASATWTLDSDGVLTIEGSGEMDDYSTSSQPGWYSSRRSITSIVIKSGITKIGKMAFYNCTKVTSVTVASTVTSIGEYAFCKCSSLTSITLPSGVTELPYAAFADCSKLSSFTASGVTTYGEYVFQNTGFSTFTIGKKVTSISDLAFFNSGVTAFAVASGNTVYSAAGGVLFTDSGKTLTLYPSGSSASSYTIPNTVTKIAAKAFAYASSLQQVTFGSGVTTLGDSAFQSSGLTSVTIPNSVTEVGMFTFYGCSSLKSVKFGTGLTSTSYEMFENCTALTDIDFGSVLTTLYARTFGYCSSLKSVTLPANITSIGNGCFGCCYALQSFSCKALTTIPYQAFLNDSALTSVSLNEGLTTINRYTFIGCTALTKVVLPSTVTFVHTDAFETTTELVTTGTTLSAYGSNGLRTAESVKVSGTRDYTKAYEVLELVNEQRAANGLSTLVMNESLLESAMQRAAEISVLFSHTRPDGSSCFSLNSLICGENIAYGDTTASKVMDSWMSSSGHAANILSESYTTIGIGCFVIDGVYYWVQCFGAGSDTSSCASPSNKSVTQTVTIAAETFKEATTTSGIVFGSSGSSYTYQLKVVLASSKLSIGKTAQATVYLKNPASSALTKITSDIDWSSSDTSVATVQDGTITAVGAGTATITATTGNGYFTAKVSVSVPLSSGSISSLKNTSKGVKIQWSKVTGASGYYIYRKTASGNYKKIKTITSGSTVSYTDTSAASGKTYYYYVQPYKGSTTGSYSAKSIYYLAAGKISTLKNTSSGIKIKWSKVTGAFGYYIYRKTSSGSYQRIKTIKSGSTLSYTDTTAKSKNGTVYTYKVVPYGGSTKGSYVSNTVARLTGTSLSTVKNASSKKMTVKWTKKTKVTGYQIQYSTSSTFASGNKTVKVSGASKVSKTISSLKKGKTYYVRIRTYKTVSGKTYYSAWSSVKKVKIAK